MIRRTFGFICALALTVGGGYLSVLLLMAEGRVKIMFLLGTFMMFAVGLYWLWADYIHTEPKPDA